MKYRYSLLFCALTLLAWSVTLICGQPIASAQRQLAPASPVKPRSSELLMHRPRALTSTVLLVSPQAEAKAARAQELLSQARAALGGEAKLKALRSLSITGTYRRVMGEREMSGEVEFDFLLPDKFLKTDTLSPLPGMQVTSVEAINGEQVWSDSRSGGGGGGMMVFRQGPGGGQMDPAQLQAALERRARAEFARLSLIWLLTAPPSFPLEFSYAGEAKAEDGSADVIAVKGPDSFAAHLFLDQKTHLPLMLSFRGSLPRFSVRSASGGGGAAHQTQHTTREQAEKGRKEEAEKMAQEMQASAPLPQEVEMQWRFSDYREVNGITWPHHLSKAANGEVNEEWEIKKIKVNPPLKPNHFEKK
jgi:hypothetical protein